MKNLTVGLILLIMFALQTNAQQKPSASLKFIAFVNAYQEDSLFSLLHDEFLMTRTYAKLTNDKTSFLNNYLPQSKKLNASYTILKDSVLDTFTQLEVQDNSDYFSYLRLVPPSWKMNIMEKEGKIQMVSIDTMPGYSIYLKNIKAKDAAFTTWLKTTHPDETSQQLFSTQGLLVKRLKEYAERAKQ